MSRAAWALVAYDVIAVVLVLWLWVRGYMDDIWYCGRRERAERRDIAALWTQRVSGVGMEFLVHDGVVENEMRRLGMV